MSTIVGRNIEKRELENAYNSNEAEFIAVYGRRRVGKTYLLKSFFQEKECVYFQVTGIYRGPTSEQLTRFAKELEATFYQGATIKVPQTWMEAFDALTEALRQIAENRKIVLFIDELPWMATRKSGVVRALEYFWNRHWANDKRIKLIVCGSAASWIIQKIVKNRGGFHNRVTRKINLKPFNLHDTALYLEYLNYQCNHQQTLKLYMVTGGVPFYLKNLKKSYSIDQNIDELFFNVDGLFFDEFNEVFSSLFENSDQYKEIVTLIADYRYGVSRNIIDEKNKLTGKGGRLSKRLADLEYAGFITSHIPFQHKKRGLYYRVSDEYCYFYLKWIAPVKDKLKYDHTINYWQNNARTPGYYNWLGYTFENVCYKHIPQIKKALKLEEFSMASPWQHIVKKGDQEQGAQIDLLFERTNAITLCEIKYTDEPFVIDKEYAQKLQQKIAVFKKVTKTNKQVFLALVSANGLKKNMYSEEIINDLIVSLDDLFKDIKR